MTKAPIRKARPARRPRQVYLGLDPGVNGALAVITGPNYEVDAIRLYSLKDTTPFQIWEWLDSLSNRPGELPFAVLEKVQGFIGTRVEEEKDNGHRNKAAAHTTFKLGDSYGQLRMALVAANIPHREARPQEWQKALGIPPRRNGEKKHQWKARLCDFARKLFPYQRGLTQQTCDALLLAEYCRRFN